MAKSKTTTEKSFLKNPKVKRKGIHAKSKTSKNKSGKNWVKPYRGQGR